MKKFALLFSFLIIISFTACKNEPAPMVKNFTGKFTAEYDGIKIQGKASIYNNDTVTLTITSPKEMDGYTYCYKKNKLTIKYENMKVETEINYLPTKAFPTVIYNVFTSLNQENNCYLDSTSEFFANYKGSCNSGKYIITTQFSMGTVYEIKMEEINFNIKFKAVKIIS